MEGLVFNNFSTQSRRQKLLLQTELEKYQKQETSYSGEALAAHIVYATANAE